jgi:hypothetical protein
MCHNSVVQKFHAGVLVHFIFLVDHVQHANVTMYSRNHTVRETSSGFDRLSEDVLSKRDISGGSISNFIPLGTRQHGGFLSWQGILYKPLS